MGDGLWMFMALGWTVHHVIVVCKLARLMWPVCVTSDSSVDIRWTSDLVKSSFKSHFWLALEHDFSMRNCIFVIYSFGISRVTLWTTVHLSTTKSIVKTTNICNITAYIYIYIYAYAYTHTYIYIYTYIYMYKINDI